MSPASSKLKLKDKKGGKEPLKVSSKPSDLVNSNGGIPASGYNPPSGTFHTHETALAAPSASPINLNGRFRNIDDIEDHNGNPYGAGIEYDAVSNNDSWSGESEDLKEKPSQPLRPESIPGADAEKREKIRLKNERKHQRQKERRAQELRERCTGFLMSRKLEALAQQLVAMGFPHERATMALILNEGRVEESVAWLFESGEEDMHIEHNPNRGGTLKIDITAELAKMTEMEMRYKVSKQEVERAIVSCEGDIENAEESLKAQKQEPPLVPPKHVTTGELVLANGKLAMAGSPQIITRVQVESKTSSSAFLQQKRDDKDLNHGKVPVTLGPSINSGTKSMQLLKKIPSKQEWAEAHQIAVVAEKHWPSTGSNPSVSYSLTSPMQVSNPHTSQMDAQYLPLGNELKNLQLGSVREPVVMERTQTMSMKQTPSSIIVSSSPGTALGRYQSDTTLNGFVLPASFSRSLSSNGIISNQLYNQLHYLSQQPFMSNGNSMDSTQGNRTRNRSASPTLLAASSLGLFSPLGTNSSSTGTSSHVDWNTGCSMLQADYTNVDWSLDLKLLQSKSNGLWSGSNHSLQDNTTRAYDSLSYGVGVKSSMLPCLSNGSVSMMKGFQDGVGSTEPTSTGGGGQDWTSPFEERDLFGLSRQFVSPPSL